MKKTIILAALITASILTGCAQRTAAPKQNGAPQETREPAKAQPAASEASTPSKPKSKAEDATAAYKTLIAHKTENYAKQSVADFNAALVSNPGSPDPLGELLAANAKVSETLSSDDENYDFIAGTMRNSLHELYCEHMGEQVAHFTTVKKECRPYTDPITDEIWYDFSCYASLQLDYAIKEPERITITERDEIFLTFTKEMQNYMDSLSEEDITSGDFKDTLTKKAAEVTTRLSTEKMELSCVVTMLEIMDS